MMAEPGLSQRASSFGSVAEDYDRFRPGPPLSAVDWVLRRAYRTAVDIGAGTGALTRRLCERADRVIAVEPDARMLEVLRQHTPEASAVRSWAECLPIRSGILDAAMVSSAWHWMDPDRTVAEVGRVVRSGGVFGVIWNGADRSVEWVAELLGRRDPSPDDQSGRGSRHRFELPPGSPFVDLDSCLIRWSLPMTREELIGLATTYSSMITLPPDRRELELDRIRAAADTALRGGAVEVPMSCRCWRAVRA